MIRRAWIRWTLASNEKYLAMLQREGWTDDELQSLRHECEALRVDLALTPPMDGADVVVITACVLAAAALAILLILE